MTCPRWPPPPCEHRSPPPPPPTPRACPTPQRSPSEATHATIRNVARIGRWRGWLGRRRAHAGRIVRPEPVACSALLGVVAGAGLVALGGGHGLRGWRRTPAAAALVRGLQTRPAVVRQLALLACAAGRRGRAHPRNVTHNVTDNVTGVNDTCTGRGVRWPVHCTLHKWAGRSLGGAPQPRTTPLVRQVRAASRDQADLMWIEACADAVDVAAGLLSLARSNGSTGARHGQQEQQRQRHCGCRRCEVPWR
jgi:hypothetical protein